MSGSTIGGVVGGVIGYAYGGQQGAQIGWMIGSAVGGYVDPDVIRGQKLSDAQQQTSMEGAPRPIIFGTAVVAGNVIQAGPLVEHKHRERTGKGGPVQESFTYTRSYAIRVCEGEIGNISRIWRNDKLVLDWRNPADWPDAADAINAMAGDSAKFASGITIYTGSEDQLPDPTLEALPETNGGGIGNVNAYRGSCYVVFTDDDLTDMQGAIPQYRFEVSCCGTTAAAQNTVNWIAGQTGSAQSVFCTGANNLTALVAGWNDNLRRTHDGGVTWNAVDYTSLGWDLGSPIEAVWHVDDLNASSGTWYMALQDKIAVSYSDGTSFSPYIDTVHPLVGHIGPGGGVSYARGTYWAGANETPNTVIFEPATLANTDIDLGADYGRATCVGEVGSTLYVGTNGGNIITESGDIKFTDPFERTTTKIICNSTGSVGLAFFNGAPYARTVDGGSNWSLVPDSNASDGVFARGKFFISNADGIYSSHDGLTLTLEDSSFADGNPSYTMIASDSYSVIAVTQFGDTAVLPSAYVLPDFASGWHLDNVGNVVGDVVTSVDRCVADLDATVLDICARVGLDASQIDVSQLAGIPLRGFVIGQPMPASDAVRTLQQGYFFDFPEWGNWPDTSTKLRAITRGGDSLFDITDDDLVETDDAQDTRAQAVEFPRKINLMTSDVDADYNPTKQTAERRTDNIKAVGETTIQLSITTLRTEAAPMAEKMLKVAWEEALGTIEFELPEEFSQLTPSDCFTKDSKRWRATQCEYGDGSVKVKAVRDRVSSYTSVATPADIPPPTTIPSVLRGPTAFAAMNLPSLRTQDNVPGMYIAVCGLLDGWAGCDLQLSVDDGTTFQSVATITNESTMGILSAACDSGATDLISVSLLHDHEIDSVTNAQIAARANAFAILTNAGSGVVPEIGQAQTAAETAAAAFDLTDLTRGELGTVAAAHNTGDQFVMLDAVTFLPLDVSLAGKTLVFRPVSLGTAAANNRTYSVVFAPLFTSAPVIDFYETELGEVITTETGDYIQVD